MGRAVAPAPAGNQVHYERRRPEETTLYQRAQADKLYHMSFQRLSLGPARAGASITGRGAQLFHEIV